MTVQDAHAANVSLWAHYLENEWGNMLDSRGRGDATRALAAAVAGWLALLVEPQIDRMYRGNAPGVTRFLAESTTPVDQAMIPPEFRRAEDTRAPAAPADQSGRRRAASSRR